MKAPSPATNFTGFGDVATGCEGCAAEELAQPMMLEPTKMW
jgi:hypothetical protein